MFAYQPVPDGNPDSVNVTESMELTEPTPTDGITLFGSDALSRIHCTFVMLNPVFGEAPPLITIPTIMYWEEYVKLLLELDII